MKPDYLKLDQEGREIPDDTPVVIRIKGNIISEYDQVRAFIRRELREQRTGEVETFEEANDFDVGEDLFPVGAAEYAEDTEAADREVMEAGDPSKLRPLDAGVKQSVNSGNASGGTGGVPPVSAVEPTAGPPTESKK